MLSYMLPVDEKPPPVPSKTQLQLNLASATTATHGVHSPGGSRVAGAKHRKKIISNGHGHGATPNATPTTYQMKMNGSNPASKVIKKTIVFTTSGGSSYSPNLPPKCLKQVSTMEACPQLHNVNIPNSLANQFAEPLTHGSMSKESSISSFLSDATSVTVSSMPTPTSTISDKSRTTQVKILSNGTTVSAKNPTLKRVSFGSSKGSMVETLIFESPLQEEPENSPIVEKICPQFPSSLAAAHEQTDSEASERSKVRVTFYQQTTPQVVSSPPPPFLYEDFLDEQNMAAAQVQHTQQLSATATITDQQTHLHYTRQESTESGWENPFRPGGELSREAEEIVELIKGGKPITPSGTTEHNGTLLAIGDDVLDACTKDQAASVHVSPMRKPDTNGNSNNNGNANSNSKSGGAVEVKRDTLGPSGEAEHVVLKKKPKCKCCVVQ